MTEELRARAEPRFDWFIPIDGDGEHIGTKRAERPPTFAYLREVVETAERLGYHSLLIPTRFANGLFEDTAPLAVTSRIRFLVAVRPGFIATGLFAQMAATLANLSDGRLDINVVPGGIQGDLERLGERISHDERYERAEEFIAACRLLWQAPEPVQYDGAVVRLAGAIVSPGPELPPRWYLGGASERALALAGSQGDQLLMWIQPLEEIAALMARARAQFAAAARPAEFGLRTHLVVRDTEDGAWAAADELLSRADPEVVAQRQAAFAGTAMVGQRAQLRASEQHRLGPHLWNGISTVRVNLGTAIVGTPAQVADELLAYWRLGIDEFILSGYPHVEECERVAADVLPLLREQIRAESSR